MGYLALTRVSGKAIQEEEVAEEILYRETLHHILSPLKMFQRFPKFSWNELTSHKDYLNNIYFEESEIT